MWIALVRFPNQLQLGNKTRIDWLLTVNVQRSISMILVLEVELRLVQNIRCRRWS